jgi:putative two-component system response regulator
LPVPELLIVDDDVTQRRWEERVVREHGYSCECAHDASAAWAHLERDSYKLALLDVNMPDELGMQTLSRIRSSHPEMAVLMVTREDSMKLAMAAIEHGAYGYMVKPVGAGELLINVANALHRRHQTLENSRLVRTLRAAVNEGSHDLEHALESVKIAETKASASQAETISRLARMVEFRDVETGHHVQRMSSYCEIIARKIGFPKRRCELLRLSSQLHDVGKVAVPDGILLKHGKLTPEEFEIMKGHVEAGYQMLSGSASETVQLGALIARTHHERWDGTGYPRGLAGENIPVEGRIAAVADVFDALTSERVYRIALPVKSAIEIMREECGSHFDPQMLDALLLALPEIAVVRQAYAD